MYSQLEKLKRLVTEGSTLPPTSADNEVQQFAVTQIVVIEDILRRKGSDLDVRKLADELLNRMRDSVPLTDAADHLDSMLDQPVRSWITDTPA